MFVTVHGPHGPHVIKCQVTRLKQSHYCPSDTRPIPQLILFGSKEDSWGFVMHSGKENRCILVQLFDLVIHMTLINHLLHQPPKWIQNTQVTCPWRKTCSIVCMRNHMMTSSNGNIFRVTGPLCGEFHRSSVNSPHKGQWRGALMFYLICAWTNGWVSNREAGDLRRHRTQYDVNNVAWMSTKIC